MNNSISKIALQSNGLSGDKSAILLLQNLIVKNKAILLDGGVKLKKPILIVKARKKGVDAVSLCLLSERKINNNAGCAKFVTRRKGISVLSGVIPYSKAARFRDFCRKFHGDFCPVTS